MTDQNLSRPDLHGFPITLLFADRKVVVVGGGVIATRKTQGLIAGGATNITIVSPEVTEKLRELHSEGKVKIQLKEFEPTDLDDAFFVVTATNSAEVNNLVFVSGEQRKIFVNSADDPKNCSSILMATARQGDITVAISTAGKSPAFASWCRRYIEGRLTSEYTTLIELVNEARENVRSQGISSEDINWDPIFSFNVVQMVKEGNLDSVREVINSTVEKSLSDSGVELEKVEK